MKLNFRLDAGLEAAGLLVACDRSYKWQTTCVMPIETNLVSIIIPKRHTFKHIYNTSDTTQQLQLENLNFNLP